MNEKILLRLLYLLGAGIVVTQVISYAFISSILFTLTFVFTFLLWLSASWNKLSRNDLLMLFVISVTIINVSCNALLAGADLSFGYIKKMIMFITSLFYLQTASKLKIDEGTELFIGNVITGLAVFLVFVYTVRGQSLYELNGKITNYLTFHFTNPNLAALFLSCIALGLMCKCIGRGSFSRKIFYLALFAAMIFFIYKTRSRNALLVVSIFLLLNVRLLIANTKLFEFRRGGAIFVTIFPILFVMVYILLSDNSMLNSALSFLISEGKLLNSRMAIWESAMKYFYQSPLIGCYYEISGGTGSSQLHNTHLDILVSYGLPVFFGTCLLLYRWLFRRDRKYSRTSYIYLISFCCVLFLGMGEAALFSGGLGIYIFGGMYLLFSQRVGNYTDSMEGAGEN